MARSLIEIRKRKIRKSKKRKHIELYCDDLIKKAKDGKIDRVIGREKKLSELFRFSAVEQRITLAL